MICTVLAYLRGAISVIVDLSTENHNNREEIPSFFFSAILRSLRSWSVRHDGKSGTPRMT